VSKRCDLFNYQTRKTNIAIKNVKVTIKISVIIILPINNPATGGGAAPFLDSESSALTDLVVHQKSMILVWVDAHQLLSLRNLTSLQ
jgi:hypothetical protein